MCIDTIELRYIRDIYLNLKYSKRPFEMLVWMNLNKVLAF